MNEHLNSIGGTVDEYTEAAVYYAALEEEKTEKYINAGALLSYLDIEREKEKRDFTKDFYSGVEFVCYEIEQFPRADVAPVVHAHWMVQKEIDGFGDCYRTSYICSGCRYITFKRWNYCPECGAKMDEEVGVQ